MLTEKGAIRTVTPFDKKMYLKLNKNNIISSSCFAAAGVLGLAGSLVYGGVSGVWDGFLIGGCAVIVALSFFLLLLVFVSVKNGVKLNKSAEADMFLSYMQVAVYENGAKTSEEKVYYDMLYKRDETADYFFAYISRTNVHPLSKNGLSPEEINTVRKLLGLPQKDEGEVPVGDGKGAVMLSDDENLREIVISPNGSLKAQYKDGDGEDDGEGEK